jgi:hypothetical protein
VEIKKIIKEKNVFITRENFIKLNSLKKLNDKEVREIFNHCPNKTYRFIGTRLYACCLAESIERTFLKKRIHIDIIYDNNWQKNLNNISLYEACRYCISARTIKNHGNLSLNIQLLKQYILLNSPLARHDFKIFWRIRRYFKNINNWYKYQNEPS